MRALKLAKTVPFPNQVFRLLHVAATVGLVALLAVSAHARAPLIPVRIVLYEGYGTPDKVTLRGRAVEDVADPTAAPDRERAPLANAVRNARILDTDEVKGLKLRLSFAGKTTHVRTDDDGLFEVEVALGSKNVAPGAYGLEARLHPDAKGYYAPVHRGRVFVLSPGPGTVVISDFDDTLVKTYVTDKTKLLQEVFLKNPSQLTPVPGGSTAYGNAMKAGAEQLFVVSGSPLGLYERIAAFLDLHRFPPRALFLKNISEDSLFAQKNYKSRRLTALLERFPEKRFVLVGDSGEKDPEIYAGLRKRFPKQVAGIVIRHASDDDKKAKRFEGITVVDDYAKDPDVIARLVRAANQP